MHVRRLIAAGLTAPLLMLAGCADEPDKPAPYDPSEAASSASPSPSESAKPETAESLIRHWIRESGSMQNSGNTEEFRTLNMDCQPCDATADRVDEIYSAGGWIKTRGMKVNKIQKIGPSGGALEYHVTVKTAPTRYVPSEGSSVESYPGGLDVLSFLIRTKGNSRYVIHYAEVSQ